MILAWKIVLHWDAFTHLKNYRRNIMGNGIQTCEGETKKAASDTKYDSTEQVYETTAE